jgi:hypothetical protein
MISPLRSSSLALFLAVTSLASLAGCAADGGREAGAEAAASEAVTTNT